MPVAAQPGVMVDEILHRQVEKRRNAGDFLSGENLQLLAELFKDRLLSLLRIY